MGVDEMGVDEIGTHRYNKTVFTLATTLDTDIRQSRYCTNLPLMTLAPVLNWLDPCVKINEKSE